MLHLGWDESVRKAIPRYEHKRVDDVPVGNLKHADVVGTKKRGSYSVVLPFILLIACVSVNPCHGTGNPLCWKQRGPCASSNRY